MADGCEISTCNFYASDLGDTNYIDELKQFVNGPNPVDIVSNNIAIAYSDLAGLPIDTNLNHGIMTYTFDIPRLGFIADCYKACAIITDKDGKCVNADMKVIDKPAVKPTIKTIRFSTDTLDLNVGSHLQIEVELDGDTGWELYDVPVWSSSDNYILSVDNSGLLSANAVGEAVVRVESSLKPSVYAEMTVSVHEVDKGFKLSLDGDKLYRETTVEIPVYLHNKYPMTGIQFDITLTDGLSFDCDESGNCNVKLDTSRTTDFSAASLLHEDNTLKVLITSFSGKYVNEGDGILFYIPIKVEASAPQTATVGISDIIVADPRNKAIKINDANRTFIIYDLKRGDVDGDSALTVADVTSIVSIILGQKEEGKIKEAADFNNDGKTDIMDVVTLINSILRSSSFKVRTTAARTDNAAEGIYIYEITEKGDDIYSVDLRVKDIDNYVAAQFDVALPEGLEFVTNDLGIEVSPDITATSNHIVSTSLQEDGSCRFISFSLSNSKYTDNEDKFLKFDIRKEEGCAENLTGEIRNILFSDANLSAVNFDDFTFNLNLGSNSVAVDLASALKISGVQGGIAVSNAPAGSDVLVYSLDGRLMNSIRVNEATVRIPAEKGIYIVRIQDTVKKVIVK